MAKRKYLIITLVISQNILSLTNAYASAWLPETGKYKYALSTSCADKPSIKKRRQKIDQFIKIQDLIDASFRAKNAIILNAKNRNRLLLDSEQREIEILDQNIKQYKKSSEELQAFNDNFSSSFEVEYGLNDNQSFGMKIDYSTIKFVEVKNLGTKKRTYISKKFEPFYKYKLLEPGHWIITAQSKMGYATYRNTPTYNIDMGLIIGYAKEDKYKRNSFHEFGISARKYFSKDIKKSIGFVFSISEGVQFKNGITIANYTEYESKNTSQYLYKATIYEQVSVAKQFAFGNLGLQNVVAQLGYFWKGSVANNSYTISGPVFSLWFDL